MKNATLQLHRSCLLDFLIEETRRFVGWLVEYGLYFVAMLDLISLDSCLPAIESILANPLLDLLRFMYSFFTPFCVKLPSAKTWVCSMTFFAVSNDESNKAQNDSFGNHAQMKMVPLGANSVS